MLCVVDGDRGSPAMAAETGLAPAGTSPIFSGKWGAALCSCNFTLARQGGDTRLGPRGGAVGTAFRSAAAGAAGRSEGLAGNPQARGGSEMRSLQRRLLAEL